MMAQIQNRYKMKSKIDANYEQKRKAKSLRKKQNISRPTVIRTLYESS